MLSLILFKVVIIFICYATIKSSFVYNGLRDNHYFVSHRSISSSCYLVNPDSVDIYDKSFSKHVVKLASRITCPQVKSLISSNVDLATGILTVTGITKEVTCYYQSFKRTANDNGVKYSTQVRMVNSSINLRENGIEFVWIKCYWNASSYSRSHSYPLPNYFKKDQKCR